MFTSFFRTIILYFLLVLFMRLMGKRQIGELQLTELVVTLLISDLASIPMQTTDLPLFSGLIPILTLLVLEIAMSYLTLKCPRFHRLLSGSSMILIDHGVIDRKILGKLRFTLEDLIEELRIQQIERIEDVEFAILETNGQLSVFPKSKTKTLPWPVILDGYADKKAMRQVGITEEWMLRYLKRQGISSPKQVFLLNVDDQKNCYLVRKEDV